MSEAIHPVAGPVWLEPCARCGHASPIQVGWNNLPGISCSGRWLEGGARKDCPVRGPRFDAIQLGLDFARGRAIANWNKQQKRDWDFYAEIRAAREATRK